jgi:hypothetical protein
LLAKMNDKSGYIQRGWSLGTVDRWGDDADS